MGILNNIQKGLNKIIDQKKCEGAVIAEKQAFLKNWSYDLLQKLCVEKGLSTIEKRIDSNNNVSSAPYSFYVLVDTVSKTVNSGELIYFAKNNGIDFVEFEKKLNSIKQFYGVK